MTLKLNNVLSELLQLKLDIGTSVGDYTSTVAARKMLPLIEVGVL